MKEGYRRWLPTIEIALIPALVVCVARAAVADPPKAQPSVSTKTRAVARPAPPPPKKPPVAEAGAPAPSTSTTPEALAPPSAPSAEIPGDAGVVEARTLDGGTRVFKFSELEIEGRLKSPQLVYFLRRVRAEFAAGDLGHRSFMREMSETRKESSF
jgi:hypothetical protein